MPMLMEPVERRDLLTGFFSIIARILVADSWGADASQCAWTCQVVSGVSQACVGVACIIAKPIWPSMVLKMN